MFGLLFLSFLSGFFDEFLELGFGLLFGEIGFGLFDEDEGFLEIGVVLVVLDPFQGFLFVVV